MKPRKRNVLFLCTGNSARSILGEALVNGLAASRETFQGYSAGSHPKGQVHPLALELLEQQRMATPGLRSKSWDEFAAPGAPQMDIVITVCDQAAGEACPLWPGQPLKAHWGLPDPAAAEGTLAQRRQAFAEAFARMRRRIEGLARLPLQQLDRRELQERLHEIGRQ